MKYSRYETLYAFCQAMEWAADTETVYQRIVDASIEYLECDSAHLHLLDIDGQTFVKHAFYIDSTLADLVNRPIAMNVGRMAKLFKTGDLIIMEDYANPHVEDEIPPAALEMGYRSAISIPLNSSSGVLGMLTVVYRRELPWAEDDHEFLLEIGRVLGMLVQRVQMSKKDVDLQVLRDRKQLSSEIHDNVSQMASAVAIRADIAQACLEDGDYEGLSNELEYVADQARQLTKVLREEMLSLRTPIEGPGNVEENLRSMFARFKKQWGIPVRLESHCDTPVYVSEYVHLQLSRIVNECLQNVLRHAQANAVSATLDRKNGNVFISIRDDGVGFDVGAVATERLGIRIMRERAKSAGGKVAVVSGSQGTTVFIEMPASRG
ncbi:MAG: GAF domain-containing protein [Eggerthellaceae bacterium]|nr:GAF domain-containing protein [Eggerthellaceae bacterium]